MTPLLWLLALLAPCQVQAAAVFAHFMVGNVPAWEENDWIQHITDAQAVGIDAFALNIAAGYEYNDIQIAKAFTAAEEYYSLYGFQLFFSFDYAGNGAWAEQDVIDLINSFSPSQAYYHYNGQPFVSTFEGPANAEDWITIKSETGCFFVPDWSSSGAEVAVGLAGGVADGLFSWAAWPYASQPSTTYIDASYSLALGDKPYMMPVSPWFYTNLPGYDKDWLWNSADLWYDRWQQAIFYSTGGYAAPEWIEILTWNDFGESHYIGPLDDRQYDLFTLGEAPYNYAENMPHDGWRTQLKWMTDLYKTGTAETGEESLVMWYRTSFATACGTGDTTGNTASQLQIEYTPSDMAADQVSISALLAEAATVEVLYGPYSYPIDWKYTPEGGAGLYYATFALPDLDSGEFGVWLYRNDGTATAFHLSSTQEILHTCTNDITNWNAYVASTFGGHDVEFEQTVSDYVCIKGWGDGDFNDVCEFICGLGYCPTSACVCQQWGKQADSPTDGGTPVDGYPANGDSNWGGLCAFVCGQGETYCSKYSAYCSTTETAATVPTVSPFTPDACTAGTGIAAFEDLCAWSCQYGYCPIDGCECTATGVLVLAESPTAGITANFTPIADNWRYNDLCTWTCSRGYCPDVCSSNTGCVSGTGDGNYAGLCDFSCGRGFCPDPCTCLATGVVAEDTTADPDITGYAAPGLDQATYDPLCNFTCSHGYCPSPNGCVSTLKVDPSLTDAIPPLPTLDYYTPPPGSNMTVGDFLRYEFEDDPDVSISVLYVDSVADLPTGILCNDVTAGADGDFLGCVGETVEWLMLTLMDDPDAITSRDTSSSNFTFAALPGWQAQANCSTHCRLQAEAPMSTWVPVGEGTHNGQPRSLHFRNTGNSLAYKAHPGSLADTTVSKRQIELLGALVVLSLFGNTALFTQIHDPNKHPIIASHASMIAMDAAVERVLTTCMFVNINDTALVPSGTDPTGFGVAVGETTALDMTNDEIDGISTTCDTEREEKRTYIIWPVDGNSVASLRIILYSFDPNTDEHISANGYGTMYYRSSLTQEQATVVTTNKQVEDVEPKCENDCGDPNDSEEANGKPFDFAKSFRFQPPTKSKKATEGPSRVQERDGVWQTQTVAPPELAFVSKSLNSDRATFVDDSSEGEGITIYMLEAEWFDNSFSEFGIVLDSNGEDMYDKFTQFAVGHNGWNPQGQALKYNHATGMLALAVGGTYGIARKATPVGVSYDSADGKAWVIDALDAIETDWAIKRLSGSPTGVLSMSFGIPRTEYGGVGFEISFKNKLRNLQELGLLPICSAGNVAGAPFKLPAIFGNPLEPGYIPNLLVVAAVTNDGAVATQFSDASWVPYYAPGVDITLPYYSSRGVEATYTASGTSTSAAKTAGLAAYFLGLSSIASQVSTVTDLRNYMINVALPRVAGVASIYNNAP